MIQESKLLGCLAQFALAGTTQVTPTPSGGPIVSKTFIPDNNAADATPVNLWVPLGVIAEVKESTKPGTTTKIYRPTPGTLQLDDVKESKYERSLTMTIEECSNFMWLAMRRALLVASPRQAGTAIGQYVSFTSGTIRGWIKFQAYNQDTNALELTEQFYCALQIDAATYGGDKNPSFSCAALQLFSTLNSSNGS